jgi:hypothetical protein
LLLNNKIIYFLQKCMPPTLGLILFTISFYLPNGAKGEEFQYQGLPPGKGRAQVLENCTVCHSSAIILQTHMSRKKWDQTLSWMQDKQGLWALQPNLRKIILDYLSTYQGAKKPPSQPHNSMGHQYSYRPNPL